MKLLEVGRKYSTRDGNLQYCGLISTPFICDRCGRKRLYTHEFCINWADYQNGYVGEFRHYGSECIKHITDIQAKIK